MQLPQVCQQKFPVNENILTATVNLALDRQNHMKYPVLLLGRALKKTEGVRACTLHLRLEDSLQNYSLQQLLLFHEHIDDRLGRNDQGIGIGIADLFASFGLDLVDERLQLVFGRIFPAPIQRVDGCLEF